MPHPLPTSSPGTERRPPGRCLHPTPVRPCRLSLHPAPRSCVCCLTHVRSTPVAALGVLPGSCQTMGGSPSRVPPCLCSPTSTFLCVSHFPESSGSWSSFWGFPSSRKGEGPGRLHSLEVARPGPCPLILGHAGAVQATPPPLPSPYPLVILIPPPGRSSWGVALDVFPCELFSHRRG